MATLPTFNKIVMVIEENHGYSEIIGSASAPYINTLVPSAALFTNSHGGPAVLHPSFPNYMQLFSGSPQGLTDDTCPPPGQPFAAANLGSAVIAAGKKFAGYAEDYPATRTSCTNTTTAKTYAGRHVPWAWFSNVPANSCLDFNTAWPTTAAGFAALPDVSIVTPNLAHDMHSYGTETAVQEITNGDSWLKANISGYLAWAKANNSLLILQWDEDQGTTADTIPTMFLGANVNPGSYAEDITHYNVLRTICELAGATPMAGAATVATITDAWQAGGSGVPGTPAGLAVTAVTATSVSLAWTAPTQGPVTGYDVYANGAKVQSPTATSTTVAGLAAGTAYGFTVDAFNGNGAGNQTAAVQATTSTTGGPVPPVVQTGQGSTTGTSLTVTLGAPVQNFHGVVVALAGYFAGTVSSITVTNSTTASTFAKVATSGTRNCEIWACLSVTGSGTLPGSTVVITTTTPGIIAYVYEIESPQQAQGLTSYVEGQNVILDKTAGNAGASGTAWSSGATGATVHGPEFVAGIGMIAENTGSITGPGGAWANLPAITSVTAGGHTYGAVSGYQVTSSTPAAYTYAGTSATGGEWAGTAATFLLMPQATPWAGYIWTEQAAPPGGFTGVSATFIIPPLSNPQGIATPGAAAFWVGLDDAQPQVVVNCTWNTTSAGNNSVALQMEFEPDVEIWDSSSFPAAAGDSLTLSVTTDGAFYYLRVTSNTQGWTYTEQVSVAYQSVSVPVYASGLLPFPKRFAEVVAESPGGGPNMPSYGSVQFTSITLTPTPLAAPVPVTFTGTAGIVQVPGPYSTSGNSFTMYWESSN